MGFDFEQMVDDNIVAKELDYSVGWSADIPGGFPVKDFIWFEHNGKKYHMLVAEQNMYCGTPLECNDADLQQPGFIDNLLAQGYLPVVGGANKKWVKVGGCADGYYSDWIVCLTEAKTEEIIIEPDPEERSIRIIAEDLSASEASDFDFNDVVFDVAIENGETWIRLQAAGGTLPLYIDTKEVHALFGLNNTTTMVNTGRGSRLDPVEVKLDNYYSNAKNIPVTVTKNGITVPLTAEKGEPASKIAVPMSANFQWCAERVSMKEQYEYFTDWCTVNSFRSEWWEQ
jgi:hypothetical protein